jgi:hypothetical protein
LTKDKETNSISDPFFKVPFISLSLNKRIPFHERRPSKDTESAELIVFPFAFVSVPIGKIKDSSSFSSSLNKLALLVRLGQIKRKEFTTKTKYLVQITRWESLSALTKNPAVRSQPEVGLTHLLTSQPWVSEPGPAISLREIEKSIWGRPKEISLGESHEEKDRKTALKPLTSTTTKFQRKTPHRAVEGLQFSNIDVILIASR